MRCSTHGWNHGCFGPERRTISSSRHIPVVAKQVGRTPFEVSMHRADDQYCGSGRVSAARSKQVPVIGIGGPVGSGKTALVEALCRTLRDRYSLAVVTNDIFTKEDAEFLTRRGALPQDRILGVETGGCPHTAIREDASHNQEALDEL